MLFRKPACDWLIVGLGNPDKIYEKNRHNVGFRVLDHLASQLGVKIDRAKYRGKFVQANHNGQKLILLKPTTFMNNSGLSVMDAVNYFKLPPERVIVIFDDISLDVGRLRVRADGSAGGHNGIKSIIGALNSQNFPRVKVGVGEGDDVDAIEARAGEGDVEHERQADRAAIAAELRRQHGDAGGALAAQEADVLADGCHRADADIVVDIRITAGDVVLVDGA
jgi:PTH1 family peptidyl-tRNA hydrolase